jgi:hypothetical protein
MTTSSLLRVFFYLELSTNNVQLCHAPPSQAEGEPAAIHEHIRELGRLSAYIALDLKAAARPKAQQARAHLESLDEWHRKLPPPMQLSRLSLARPFTIDLATKRSLLQSHILFLGTFIEPYRKCLVDLGSFRLSNTLIEFDNLEDLNHLEEQCVLAARQSARVASLLQIDNLVRAHCWVSMCVSPQKDRDHKTANARSVTLASLAAQYSSSAPHRNYLGFTAKKSAKTSLTHPRISISSRCVVTTAPSQGSCTPNSRSTSMKSERLRPRQSIVRCETLVSSSRTQCLCHAHITTRSQVRRKLVKLQWTL